MQIAVEVDEVSAVRRDFTRPTPSMGAKLEFEGGRIQLRAGRILQRRRVNDPSREANEKGAGRRDLRDGRRLREIGSLRIRRRWTLLRGDRSRRRRGSGGRAVHVDLACPECDHEADAPSARQESSLHPPILRDRTAAWA